MLRSPTVLGPALLLAAPLSAWAQPAAPETCAGLTADIERLACYDAIFKRGPDDTRAADEAARAAALALAAQEASAKAGAPARTQAEADPTDESARIRDALRGRIGKWFPPSRHPDTSEVLPLENPAQTLANAGRGSLLDSRWELARDSKFGVFNLRSYKPIYALPVFWTSDTNPLPSSPNLHNTVTEWHNQQPVEGKFQLSFKTKIVENLFGDNGDLWGAYTQTSRWQMYNGNESRPFRETNYEPELMLMFRNRYHIGGWNGRMAGIGINHQSNGQGDPHSRSWNRIIGTVGLDRENWALVIRPWWRVPEGNREDNNPDIDDYIGRGDAMLVWRLGSHEISTIARHSLKGGERSHGSLQLDWGFPIDDALRGHIQIFSGYGESLIDYNHKATYIGVGISLLEWF